MGLTLVTDAVSLPVTLQDIKAELLSYADAPSNDAIVTAKLYEAVNYIQNQTQRQFILATWLQTFDSWSGNDPNSSNQSNSWIGNGCSLGIQPVSSVTSVKYYNTDSTLTTVSNSDYWVDVNHKPPRVVFKPSFGFPAWEVWRPSPIEVTFVAGYANAAAVPQMAKLAIKLLAGYWFEQREAASVNSVAAPGGTGTNAGFEIPYGVTQIMNMLRADGYT